MENAFPALLIGGILVLAAALLAGVTNQSVNTVGESWREMELLSEERLGTDLAIVSTALDPGGQTLDLTLRNDGRTSIVEFERMDLIANYDGGSGRYNLWLPYSEEAPQPNDTWEITSFTDDNKNPGILDGGEQVTIRVQLQSGVTGAGNRWVSLATTVGVTYTVPF